MYSQSFMNKNNAIYTSATHSPNLNLSINTRTNYPSTAPCSPTSQQQLLQLQHNPSHSLNQSPTDATSPHAASTTLRKRRTSSLTRFTPDAPTEDSNEPKLDCMPSQSTSQSDLEPHQVLLPAATPPLVLPLMPPCSPVPSADTPVIFKRSRARSSLPRPSSLLPQLDHLPIELLYVIAEYVSTPTKKERMHPMLAPRLHVRLAQFARTGKRLAAAVTPVLYRVPAIETVAQLRRLVLSVHVSCARVLVHQNAPHHDKCTVHPLTWPLFSYIRGIDIARLEDLARSHVAVHRLVTRFLVLVRSRSYDFSISPTPMGLSVVDDSLAMSKCICFPNVSSHRIMGLPAPLRTVDSSARGTACTTSPTSPSTNSANLHLLRRSTSLHQSPLNSPSLPPATDMDQNGVYGMDLHLAPPLISSSDPLQHLDLDRLQSYPVPDSLPIPKLTYLNLSFVKCIASTSLSSLLLTPASFMRITHLNLSGTQLSDTVISSIISPNAPWLERLALAWNPQLTDLSLASLASHASPNDHDVLIRLTHLDLTHCRDISDWGLARIAPRVPNLRALGLAWCPRISARVVHAALSYWPHLHAISVMGCPRIGGSKAIHRMWAGYVLADIELRTRVERVAKLVDGGGGVWRGYSHLGQAVGLVKRVDQLLVDPDNVVFYLDV